MSSPAVPLGVVLAGGASSRLGYDKAFLVLDGLPLAEHAARKLAMVCGEVVVADGGRGALAGRVSVDDSESGGPAAGILGAAARYPGRALLVLACDLPLVPAELLASLCDDHDGDWVVPRWQRGLEPLAALYRPAALAVLGARAGIGHSAPKDLAAQTSITTRYLEGAALARFGPAETVFLNLNRPADLQRLEMLRGGTDIALHPQIPEG